MMFGQPKEETIANRHLLNACTAGCIVTAVEISVRGYFFHLKSPQGKEVHILAASDGLRVWNEDMPGSLHIAYEVLDKGEGDYELL